MLSFIHIYYVIEEWYMNRMYKCLLRPIKLSFITDDYELLDTNSVYNDIILYQSTI